MTFESAGYALVLLVVLGAILKESWWDNRPKVVQRRKDERLGSALRVTAKEKERLLEHLQRGVISRDHYEKLLARVNEAERDARVWND